MKRVWAWVGLLAACAGAKAADVDELNFLGVSDDGHSAAYEVFGFHDGSGHPYSRIEFFDLAGNKSKSHVESTGDTEDMADKASLQRTRDQALVLAKSTLSQIKLTPGKRLGRPVILPTGGKSELRTSGQFSIKVPYELALQLRPAERSSQCGDKDGKSFTLLVKNKKSGTTRKIDSLNPLANFQGCPGNYGIDRAYQIKKDRLLLFLNVVHPGFEGMDKSYLVLTVRLP